MSDCEMVQILLSLISHLLSETIQREAYHFPLYSVQ